MRRGRRRGRGRGGAWNCGLLCAAHAAAIETRLGFQLGGNGSAGVLAGGGRGLRREARSVEGGLWEEDGEGVRGHLGPRVVGLSERSSALVPSRCLFSVQRQSNQHQSRSHQHANLSSKGWEARRPDTHTDCISGLPELGNMSRR